MNNTKRLFALVLSVVMLMSMLSGFGMASGANLANAATTGIDISGTGVGAAPSTDMAELDVMADDVLIIDSGISVNEDTYSLVWNNEQIDDIPVAGKVFKSFYAVQFYAENNGITNPKIIVKKLDSNLDVIDITMELSIYTQAYNTMPFVTGGSALEPWTYNISDEAYDDYDELTYALPAVEIAGNVTGKIGIYGFTLTGGIINTDRKGELDIELVNSVVDSKASVILDLENDVLKAENTDSLVIKNMYVKNTADYAKLISGYIAANTVIDGLYVNASEAVLETKTSIKQAGLKSKLVIKNSHLAGSELIFGIEGDPGIKMERSAVKTVEIKNNIFDGLGGNAYAFAIAPSRYTSLAICNNYIASGNGTAALLATIDSDVYNATRLEVEIRENIMNGIASDFSLYANGSVLRDCKMDVADNYVTPVYSDDLEGVSGVEFNAPAHGMVCKSYYSDYKMTNKCNGAVAIAGASATNGDVFVNNSTNTIYYIMNSGDASELTVTFGDPDAVCKWYEDSACTKEIAAENINMQAAADTYYLRSEYSNSEGTFTSEPYAVTIVREAPSIPYFSKAYTDESGLLSNNAIFCNINCGWVTDGSLYAVDWQGKQYTFIKGVNLFENIDAAITYAKSNNIKNPEFVLMDMNGSHTYTSRWFPSYPGKYYTANYATKPYIGEPGMEASEWKSNVGTGDGQYNDAEGISIAGITLNGSEPEGDYKLYGFTMTAGIADGRSSNRANCVNIYLENCYINIATWSWAIFAANDAEPTTTTPTEDILYIKDTYLNSNGSANRLFTGWQASQMTFDGLFLNAGAYSTAQDYIKQNTKTASFRIINSHIKDYSTVLNNQANNKEIASGENKSFEISNTIFNNGRIGSNSAVTAYTRAWNKITIKDNVIINDTLENFQIFKYLYQSTISGNPCTLTVTGNKAYNTLGTFDFGSRARSSDSVVADNYVTAEKYQPGTVTYGGIKLTANNGTSALLTGDYWVDSAMTVRPNKLVDDYNFTGVNVVTDKAAKTIKYIPLTQGDIGFVETVSGTNYEYKINLAHIIDNKYGNKMTLSEAAKATNSVDAYEELTVTSTAKLDTLNLKLSVSSPDGTAEPVVYTVTITNDGPAIEGITVGGNAVTFADGKYIVELSGRGSNEEIVVATKLPGSTVSVTKDGVPVSGIQTVNGATDTYKVSVTYGSDTVTVDLEATRRGAEFDDFDRVLAQTDGIDDSDWLEGFKGVFQSLRAKMSSLDRATATQTEVDALANQMEALINDAVTEDEFNAAIKEAKRIKNHDGKYCSVTYDALQNIIDEAYNRIKTISDRAGYDGLMDELQAAVDALTGHIFENYVHDNGTETCVGNGTKTAKCNTAGCTATDTVAETESYANGVHVFTKYVYNDDATHLEDGTQTAMCDTCQKVADTKTAAGTKLVLINSATTFTDVKATDWYKEFVDYVATYKFMTGTSATTFEPTKTITRAEFVKLLANLSGVDTSDNSVATKFTDLKAGAWYVGAVKWAADNGIVSGTSETTFAPDAVITREQMCVMLVNYTKFTKITLKKTVAKSEFSDHAKISDWALDAVYACQQAGIVSGKGNGFDPQGTALRAEAAVIIKIFHENYLLA